MKKVLFNITGMTCSACSARIEKILSKMDGISEVTVNLLTNSMTVSFDEEMLNENDIIKKVEGIGYGATLKSDTKREVVKPRSDVNQETDSLRKRLIISLIFTIPLFYISMGEMIGLPIPDFLTGMGNSLIYAFTLFLLALPVISSNRKYFQNGIKNLFKLSPNMDSLIAIGSGTAFIYGVYAVYKIGWGLGHGNMEMVHKFSMDLYFESSAMILTLITLGKFFEARAKSRTTQSISKLMNLAPKTAVVIRNAVQTEIPIEEVVVNDVIIVKEGTSVPVDGVVIDGHCALDESVITGESLPVEKNIGDNITAGTINQSGYLKMTAKAVGNDTALAKIIQLVEEATSSKAPISKLADKISGIFVPVVILISLITLILWLVTGKGFDFALTNAISVLVISCPCALGLATPTAIMVGTGKGASNGILIKSAESLEVLHGINVVVLDKTGTITEGKPVVTDIIAKGITQNELLNFAASLESMSAHPLSVPIVEKAIKSKMSLKQVNDYKLIAGQGIIGNMDNIPVYGGNKRLMQANGIYIDDFAETEMKMTALGKTLLYFAKEKTLLGAIAVSDTVKPTSKEAVSELSKMGLEVIMLTGDNKSTAEAIRKEVGLSNVIAEVLPEDKENEIRRLQGLGKKVVMVGDGINDAPALARADVGIAIGAGTDIAIESADIVLMKSDLYDVVTAIKLSKATMRNIKQNLFWAFIYNVIGIPIAAGVFYNIFGWLLNPMIAAAAMSFSSVSVVTNALRLNFFKPQRVEINNIKEVEKMTKVIKIEGMSCMHCSGAVTKSLNGLNGVSAEVNLEDKSATVEVSDSSVTDDILRTVIEDAGYEVLEIV